MSQQEPSGILEVLARAAGAGVSNAAQNFRGDQQQKKADALQGLMAIQQQQEQERAVETHRQAMLLGGLRMDKLNHDINIAQMKATNLALPDPTPTELGKAKATQENAYNAALDPTTQMPTMPDLTEYMPIVNQLQELGLDFNMAIGADGQPTLNVAPLPTPKPPTTASVRAEEKHETSKRQKAALLKANKLFREKIQASERGNMGLETIDSPYDLQTVIAELKRTGGRYDEDIMFDDKDTTLIDSFQVIMDEYGGAETVEENSKKLDADSEAWGVKEYGNKWNTKTAAEKRRIVEHYRK